MSFQSYIKKARKAAKEAKKKNKKEGTSQTYGQKVVQGNEGSTPTTESPQEGSVAQTDTVIQVVAGSDETIDNSAVALAAAANMEVIDLAATREDLDVRLATVVGSAIKSKEEVKKALEEASKVNLSITLRSPESETVNFNTLRAPTIEADFVYNFYTPDESDIVSQEDQSQDPLLRGDIYSVPRYVHLRWEASKISEPLTDLEQLVEKAHRDLRRETLQKSRGVSSNRNSNFKNSYRKSLKRTELINDSGVKKELVDIHKLDEAFNFTVNKKIFSNALCATFNVEDQKTIIDSLPIKDEETKKLLGEKMSLDGRKMFVKVSFTNRGLAKVFSNINDLSPSTPDREAILEIGRALHDVKIEKEQPDKFASIVDFLGIDYVGYVIEKERLNKDTGDWVLIDEYKIIGSESNSFKDTRVAYGNLYRYRIKSVAKLTLREKKEVSVNVEEFLKLIEEKIKQDNIKRKKSLLARAAAHASRGLTYKNSSGKKSTKIKTSEDTTIIVDDSSILMFKDVFEGTPETLSLIERLTNPKLTESQLQNILNTFASAQKKIITEVFSYYFESDASKVWSYAEIVESLPPPPPSTIKIVPNTPKNVICLYWLKPGNAQQDISNFSIYRRAKVGDEWKKLTTVQESANLYIDSDVSVNEKYIYAMTSVDAHGLESFLSTQIEASLNPKYAIEKQERQLRWVGGSGAMLDEVDAVFRKFYRKREQIIAKTAIVLSPNAKFNDASKDLVIKIKSLDTHYQTELKVTLKNVNTDGSE